MTDLAIDKSYKMRFGLFKAAIPCTIVAYLECGQGYLVRLPSGVTVEARWDEGLVVHA